MRSPSWRTTITIGLIAGIAAVSLSAIGMVETFDERDVIAGIVTLGQILLFSPAAIAGYLVAQNNAGRGIVRSLLAGAVAGLMGALPLVGLILLATVYPDIRNQLVNVSAALIEILTFGLGSQTGSLVLIAVNTVICLLGVVIYVLPVKIRRPLLAGLGVTLVAGVMSEVFLSMLRPFPRDFVNLLFAEKGIQLTTAIALMIIVPVFTAWWDARGHAQLAARRARRSAAQVQRQKVGGGVIFAIFLLFLPLILGRFLTQVVDNVGLYILMGFGLNIVVGFAGLLDLGYVAFFAIGAYTMGLLTSQGELGIANMSFWAAVPISVLAATVTGLILGTPVLRMRGDYLAIVTLGFGEIIRVLVTSDLLKETIGGAQGVLQIPRPEIATVGFTFIEPGHFYYLILAGCVLAAFVSWRLRDARLGRRWMAMREDEDVAEAMGIHLVTTKLLAFGMGAAFAGLAGAINASKLGSIFPNSFGLIISINVLSLIIVGGMGSLPGVVVGALVLVGLPELLREFTEYRLLIYGALLIAMMIARPEGLWPSAARRRELHARDESADVEEENGMEATADGIA